MPRKRYSPEQIIYKLRQAEVLLSQGQTVAQACKEIETSEQTYYRWRREYGGMSLLREVGGLDEQLIYTQIELATGWRQKPFSKRQTPPY